MPLQTYDQYFPKQPSTSVDLMDTIKTFSVLRDAKERNSLAAQENALREKQYGLEERKYEDEGPLRDAQIAREKAQTSESNSKQAQDAFGSFIDGAPNDLKAFQIWVRMHSPTLTKILADAAPEGSAKEKEANLYIKQLEIWGTTADENELREGMETIQSFKKSRKEANRTGNSIEEQKELLKAEGEVTKDVHASGARATAQAQQDIPSYRESEAGVKAGWASDERRAASGREAKGLTPQEAMKRKTEVSKLRSDLVHAKEDNITTMMKSMAAGDLASGDPDREASGKRILKGIESSPGKVDLNTPFVRDYISQLDEEIALMDEIMGNKKPKSAIAPEDEEMSIGEPVSALKPNVAPPKRMIYDPATGALK